MVVSDELKLIVEQIAVRGRGDHGHLARKARRAFADMMGWRSCPQELRYGPNRTDMWKLRGQVSCLDHMEFYRDAQRRVVLIGHPYHEASESDHALLAKYGLKAEQLPIESWYYPGSTQVWLVS